jgi:hypothetical protein
LTCPNVIACTTLKKEDTLFSTQVQRLFKCKKGKWFVLTWSAIEVDNKGSRPCTCLDEHLHHPKINISCGFEWLP